MKNVIFLAPPSAGKGTLSKYLVDKYGYNHISTGDLLRNVAKEDTELGRNVASLMKEGKYIGDDIVLPLFKEELLNQKDKPFILDGIPRTIDQAKYLYQLLEELNVNNYIVINMEIEDDILRKRSTGRRVCKNCKTSYNIYFDEFKPKNENVCDDCNGELIQREDDNEETFNNRLNVYKEETEPLIKFYQEKNCLVALNANQDNQAILKDLDEMVKGA